jgi:hypothetical protein
MTDAEAAELLDCVRLLVMRHPEALLPRDHGGHLPLQAAVRPWDPVPGAAILDRSLPPTPSACEPRADCRRPTGRPAEKKSGYTHRAVRRDLCFVARETENYTRHSSSTRSICWLGAGPNR